MRKVFHSLLLILIISIFMMPAAVTAKADQVYLITATGPVTPAMEQYISRGISIAEQSSASLIIIELNTPGGQIDIMNQIVSRIRASSIPVVVYVTPRGAMAASAGTVITLAGHAAAMAPETIIGAASPVGAQGEDVGETMEAKAKEALMATVRTLAGNRSPEAIKLAQETISDARAVSATEALDAGLVDIIAEDVPDLLDQLDGRTLQLADGPITLATSGLTVAEIPQSFIEQLLATLTNPNIVFLLITIGVQAILIELSSPGGWVAGFLGACCLALAVYGLGILPINWFGIVFIIMSVVLFIMDFYAPTHGALTAAGAGSFIIGSLVLFNSPNVPSFLRVSVPLVIGTGVLMALALFALVGYAFRSRRAPIRIGQETMVGKTGKVIQTLSPSGSVLVSSETWSAESLTGETIARNKSVRVVEIRGLRLIVEKEKAKTS